MRILEKRLWNTNKRKNEIEFYYGWLEEQSNEINIESYHGYETNTLRRKIKIVYEHGKLDDLLTFILRDTKIKRGRMTNLTNEQTYSFNISEGKRPQLNMEHTSRESAQRLQKLKRFLEEVSLNLPFLEEGVPEGYLNNINNFIKTWENNPKMFDEPPKEAL